MAASIVSIAAGSGACSATSTPAENARGKPGQDEQARVAGGADLPREGVEARRVEHVDRRPRDAQVGAGAPGRARERDPAGRAHFAAGVGAASACAAFSRIGADGGLDVGDVRVGHRDVLDLVLRRPDLRVHHVVAHRVVDELPGELR